MKKNFFIFIICLVFFKYAKADNFPTGACALGMANATVAVPSIWSAFHNQAGLDYLNNTTLATYFQNWFGIQELGVKSLAFALPTNTGTFGLDYTYFGFSEYNEMKIGLAYSKKFSEYIACGIQLDYFNFFQQAEYGNIGVAVAEIGIIAEPINNLKIGMHIFNPWITKITKIDDMKMPTIFRLGAAYNFANKVLLSAEIEKHLDRRETIKAGIEYNILQNIYLRTGISTYPIRNSFGIGYAVKRLAVDLGFYKHQVLGYNGAISIYYKFGNISF